jgi:amino acid transporter
MPAPTGLKRSITLPLLVFYGLGNILGAGIYALIGKVAGSAGLYSPVAFLVSALLAGLTAFSYAELSARLPLSAAEAAYVQSGFHWRPLTQAVGTLIALSGIVSAATISHGFAGYLEVFVTLPQPLVIVAVLVLLGALAAWGIAESVLTSAIITAIEIGGLMLVIWVSRAAVADLPARLPELVPPAEPSVWVGIMLGAFLAFYAFIGFEDMVNVAEEVKRPERTLPWAIFAALGITAILYLGVALAAVLSVPAPELAASEAPLALVYQRATGDEPRLIAAVSLFAVINGALIQIIMASRVAYGMGRQGWAPTILAWVNPVTRTPVLATVLVTLMVIGFALFLDITALARMTSFFIMLVFAAVNLALVVIKRRGPAPPGVTSYPTALPLAGFVSCLGFVAFQSFQSLAG